MGCCQKSARSRRLSRQATKKANRLARQGKVRKASKKTAAQKKAAAKKAKACKCK